MVWCIAFRTLHNCNWNTCVTTSNEDLITSPWHHFIFLGSLRIIDNRLWALPLAGPISPYLEIICGGPNKTEYPISQHSHWYLLRTPWPHLKPSFPLTIIISIVNYSVQLSSRELGVIISSQDGRWLCILTYHTLPLSVPWSIGWNWRWVRG